MRQNSVSEIVEIVCQVGRVDPHLIIGSRRTMWITKHRQIAMHLSRERTVETALSIAHQLGRKDHTTVLYADRLIAKLREDDLDWQKHIAEMVERLDQARRDRSVVECPQVAIFPLAPVNPSLKRGPKFRKPSNDEQHEQPYEQKLRTCMTEGCDRELLSKHFGDRFCRNCKINRRNNGGFDQRLGSATA